VLSESGARLSYHPEHCNIAYAQTPPRPATGRMKILLWKIGALGDVLMTTPLVRQLRKALPEARIDYLTGNSCVAVIEGNANLDRVIGFDESILFRAKAARLGEVVRLLRGYDAVFVLDKHWIFQVLAWFARVPVRVGFMRRWHEGVLHTHRVPYGHLRHEIHCYLDLAAAYGLPVDLEDVRVELPPAGDSPVPPPYCVLVNSGGANAGETSDVRRMPDALFGALVRHCSASGPVVFLGSREERAYYERHMGETCLNLCGQTGLRQAWAVLAQAQTVYATDSGLMHMAAAVNPRLTAIFGPTHPARKCPPGARWTWADDERYDDRYEVFGAVPRGTFFQGMELADILQRARPSPLSRGTREAA
jgi:ADP-heptose:LPS heptosyltransferase